MSRFWERVICRLFHKKHHVIEFEQGGYYFIDCNKCGWTIVP